MNAFRMIPDEIQRWERDGYFVRENVFSYEENDHLRQVAEDIGPQCPRRGRTFPGKVREVTRDVLPVPDKNCERGAHP